jgi:hypothetical protein
MMQPDLCNAITLKSRRDESNYDRLARTGRVQSVKASFEVACDRLMILKSVLFRVRLRTNF